MSDCILLLLQLPQLLFSHWNSFPVEKKQPGKQNHFWVPLGKKGPPAPAATTTTTKKKMRINCSEQSSCCSVSPGSFCVHAASQMKMLLPSPSITHLWTWHKIIFSAVTAQRRRGQRLRPLACVPVKCLLYFAAVDEWLWPRRSLQSSSFLYFSSRATKLRKVWRKMPLTGDWEGKESSISLGRRKKKELSFD